MATSISDLLTPQTPAQVRTTMVTALVALGVPANNWVPGGALSLLLTVVATILSTFTTLMAQAIGSGFLPTASGGWLTLLAYYVYGVTRPAATFATGSETLTNTGGGVFNYGVGQVTFLDPVNRQTYTNTQVISLGALATQTVTIQCTTAGKVGSAPPGEISQLVTTMLGVTVTNAASVVGQDAMDDPTLRTMCTNKLGAMSVRGPRSAYAYAVQVAVNAVSGAPVNINRQSISRSSHTGTVSVIVAAPSGAPDPNDVTGVANSIEQGVPGLNPPFSGARPDCVTVTVAGAVNAYYTPTMTVWASAKPGLDPTTVSTQIADSLTNYLASFPIGGAPTDLGSGLWASGVEANCGNGVGTTILEVEGAIDLPLLANQVAVDEIALSVRLVSFA